jgi:hypothetical protein
MAFQKQYAMRTMLACLLLGASACSSATDEPFPVAGQQAIVGGEFDTAHTNVFGLVTRAEMNGGVCSATLIAPNLLLTARHCVSTDGTQEVICGQSGLGETRPPEDIFATNEAQLSSDSRWFRASEVHVPSEGDDTCGFDVALVVLANQVPLAISTAAVPRIDREVEQGEVYDAVGYGLADGGRFGARRVRTGLLVECEPGRCGRSVGGGEFIGDTGVCEGDSGGPAFDADGKVVGVVSRGAEDCSTPIYSTVTAWRDLIIEVAAHAATIGGYEAPFWVKSGSSDQPVPPEPPPPKAGLGEPCQAANDCREGAACYQAEESAPAQCVALCTSDADCAAGTHCAQVDQNASGACLAGDAPVKTLASSCALAAPAQSGAAAWLSAGLGLVFALARRRRGRLAQG